jgi:hypothetical protein
MTKFSEEILGKIKHDHIAPVPRWHFLLKSSVFWGILAISILLGSLSFSVIMHIIDIGDLYVFNKMHGNFLTSTIMLLPYFWVISVTAFSLLAYYNWKHTKLGYRFKRRWIVSGSVVISVFMGSIFYALGMGNKIDTLMSDALPIYDNSKHDARAEIWMQPDNGLLVGKVISVDDAANNVVIEDASGQDWSVNDKDLGKQIDKSFKKGKIIKIVGKKNGDHGFVANEIRKCGDCQHDEATEVVENDGDEDDVKPEMATISEQIPQIDDVKAVKGVEKNRD